MCACERVAAATVPTLVHLWHWQGQRQGARVMTIQQSRLRHQLIASRSQTTNQCWSERSVRCSHPRCRRALGSNCRTDWIHPENIAVVRRESKILTEKICRKTRNKDTRFLDTQRVPFELQCRTSTGLSSPLRTVIVLGRSQQAEPSRRRRGRRSRRVGVGGVPSQFSMKDNSISPSNRSWRLHSVASSTRPPGRRPRTFGAPSQIGDLSWRV
jgi:hypothetical protein